MTVMSVAAAPEAGAEAPVQGAQPNSSSAAANSLPTPMAAVQNTPEQNASRPEGLPQEFASMADFTAAYNALKTGQTSETPTDEGGDLNEQVETAGVDLEALTQEWLTNGSKLSEAKYAALAKAGISRDFVDAALSGREAAYQAELTDIKSVVGGDEGLKRLQEWGTANLPQSERDALNSVIDTAPAEVVKLTLLGLQAKFDAANGSEPNLVGGGSATSVVPFASTFQVTQAMSDPRYAQDPSYRDEVARRLAVSSVL